MKKYIILMVSLATVFAVATLTSTGFLSTLFGALTIALAACSGMLLSHALVDAYYNPIRKEPTATSKTTPFPLQTQGLSKASALK
ncbi:hypothetical protein ACFQ4C_20285 [Larkinella insperata]|uniref:Uncharacterized protein n=1 Tax=Larkinella insperata TaxID=332158 RepID=A0ABW3QKD8_9BACT|nr:hypothetical protein [Larkinella insperata]